MAVSAADVARVKAGMPASSGDLSALWSISAVCAYVAQQAREQGEDEADNVEVVVRAADVSGADLRKARRVLARLGYTRVAARLGELASKSRPNRSNKPVKRARPIFAVGYQTASARIVIARKRN